MLLFSSSLRLTAALCATALLAGCGGSERTSSGERQELAGMLAQVADAADERDRTRALAALEDFRVKVADLHAAGKLTDKDARALRSGAAQAMRRVRAEVRPRPEPEPEPPAPLPSGSPPPADDLPVDPAPAPSGKDKREDKPGKGKGKSKGKGKGKGRPRPSQEDERAGAIEDEAPVEVAPEPEGPGDAPVLVVPAPPADAADEGQAGGVAAPPAQEGL